MPAKASGQRLKRARMLAGYATAKAFYEPHGIPQPTYTTHENGTRKMSAEVAQDYADKLNCSASWLLTGEGPEPEDPLGGQIPPSLPIREADIRNGMGSDGQNELTSQDFGGPTWRIPKDFLQAQTTAPAPSLRVVRIYGDSMAPAFNPGERVLVDTSDIKPSPSGVFVLFDGLGVIVKRLEHIPYSNPSRIRMMSVNPDYQSYERDLSEVTISGRVIAKWLWT